MKLSIILFFLITGSNLLHANSMKRCYEKDAAGYRITMDFTPDTVANLAIWKIYLHLPDDSILLDKYASDQFDIYELREVEHASRYIIIGDADVINQDVYIVMTRFDEIYLMKYRLVPAEKQVIRSEHHIEEDEESYDSFRPRYFKAAIKHFSTNQLWATWYRRNLLCFNCLTDDGFKIVFEKKVEKIPGTLPDNLEGNPAEIVSELRRVLNSPPDKKNSTFKYVGYLDETDVVPAMKYRGGKRGDGITYFFYKKDIKQPLKVIRYDNYNKVWLFSGYKEEKTPINRFVDE